MQCPICLKKSTQVCAGCKGVFYCDQTHQKDHWKSHKPTCKKLAEAQKIGWVKDIITPGEAGKVPTRDMTVTMSYKGTFANELGFDEGSDFKFTLGRREVIKGWDEAVATMCLGEKAMLYLSANYAYGAMGAGEEIPPNMPLIFEVQLLAMKQ